VFEPLFTSVFGAKQRREAKMMKAILIKKDFKNILLIQIPILLLFVGYQINWLYEDSIIAPAFNAVILSLVAVFLLKHINVKFVGILLFSALIIAGVALNPVKAMAAMLMFGYGYCTIIKAEKPLNQILRILFIVNTIVIIFQLIGVDSIFYKFQFYSEARTEFTKFIDLLNGEDNYVYMHQSRPSGIFPSTIYLSVFHFLIFGQLIASESYGHKAMKFLTGIAFALVGSTTTAIFFLFSLIVLFRKKQLIYFQYGFLSGMVFLYTFLYSIYFQNYTLAGRLSRVDTRLVNTETASSLFTGNFEIFALISVSFVSFILVMGFYFRKHGQFSILAVLLFLMMCIGPLVLHPIIEDIRYWFIVGTAFGQLFISFSTPIKKTNEPKFEYLNDRSFESMS
jgi:hypothetical protein